MARFCNHYGNLIFGVLMAMGSSVVYAQAVEFNMLIKGGTIAGLETDIEVNCKGDLTLDFETDADLLFTTSDCAFLDVGAIDFTAGQQTDLTMQIDFTSAETSENFNFPTKVTSGEGPLGENSIFNLVLDSFITPPQQEPEPEPEPNPAPTPTTIDTGPYTVTENDCAWARENDPGFGVFEPGDGCPKGPKIIIYDGSSGKDTEIPGCIDQPFALPATCRGMSSIIGHTIYSQRFKMRDLGKAKELIGMFQATTINTMIGENVSNLKNVIISISENPGAFNNVSTACKDVTASENSDVFITQAGSDISQDSKGKFCELVPGQTYYVNTRHDAGDSINCGINGTCQHTVVDRTVEPQ